MKYEQRYKFPIAICPLCGKDIASMGEVFGPRTHTWQCNESVTPITHVPIPHYQVEWDKNTGVIVQHIVVGEFFLDTFNTDWLTRIHTKVYSLSGSRNVHVVTVPQIRPDSSENLLERVKTLVLFS